MTLSSDLFKVCELVFVLDWVELLPWLADDFGPSELTAVFVALPVLFRVL